MKRRWRDADVYLLFNESDQPLDATMTLSSAPGGTEIWDTQTASITSLAGTNRSRDEVTLQFSPHAARVIVVREKPQAHSSPTTLP